MNVLRFIDGQTKGNLGLHCLRLCLRAGFWRGGEGKAYGVVNPWLRVLKKQGKGFGGFEGLHLSNFKVPPTWGVLGG